MLCATCQTQVANCLAVTLPTLPQEGLQLLRKAFAVSDRSWPRCSGDSPTFGLFQQLSGKKFSELFDQPELRHRAILGWIVQGLKICFFLCSFSPSLTENSSTAQFWHFEWSSNHLSRHAFPTKFRMIIWKQLCSACNRSSQPCH